MSNYPKIGIRPTIDGRQGGVRESLEEKTMNLAKSVAKLISENLRNGDGSPVECVIADSTIGRVAESAALVYGPIVLACNKMTLFDGDRENPEEWIEPIQKDGYSFAFRTKPGHVKPYEHLTREFYPYYEIPQMQWYYMYSRFTK